MEGITSFLKATKAAVLNIPEIEQKVLDATNNEKWGPTGPQMKEISKASFQYNEFPIIMNTIWKRLQERTPDRWRHVYKSLLLLDYMIKNGTDQVVNNCRLHLMALQGLSDYHAFEGNEDKGISVRERARLIVELLHDESRLRDERDKASANRSKFQVSMSSESGGSGYSGFGNSGGYSGGGYDPYSRPSTDHYATPGFGGADPRPASYEDSRQSGSYLDSRPGYSAPKTESSRPKYNDFIEEEEEEEDEDDLAMYLPNRQGTKPTTHNAQPQAQSSRPRAPSGGSGSTPAPKQAQPAPQQPPVDLLGLGAMTSGPATTAPSQPDFGEFLSSTQPTQPTSQNFFQSTGQQVSNQPQDNNWGAFASATSPTQPGTQQSINQQNRRPQSVQKPVLSEADAKDPWKKGADLFSLETLSAKSNDKPVQHSTGQKISLNLPAGQQQYNQYSNLRGNYGQNPNMGMNPGMMNMGMNQMNPNMGMNQMQMNQMQMNQMQMNQMQMNQMQMNQMQMNPNMMNQQMQMNPNMMNQNRMNTGNNQQSFW